MCRLGLGLKAPALAWPWLEEIVSRAQSQNSGLASGLLVYMYNFALFDLEMDLNIFTYLPYSVITLFYSFLSAGGAESCQKHTKSQ